MILISGSLQPGFRCGPHRYATKLLQFPIFGACKSFSFCKAGICWRITRLPSTNLGGQGGIFLNRSGTSRFSGYQVGNLDCAPSTPIHLQWARLFRGDCTNQIAGLGLISGLISAAFGLLPSVAPGQSHEGYLDDKLADLRRPYGAGSLLFAPFPTLKRGANHHCASGAIEIRMSRVKNIEIRMNLVKSNHKDIATNRES